MDRSLWRIRGRGCAHNRRRARPGLRHLLLRGGERRLQLRHTREGCGVAIVAAHRPKIGGCDERLADPAHSGRDGSMLLLGRRSCGLLGFLTGSGGRGRGFLCRRDGTLGRIRCFGRRGCVGLTGGSLRSTETEQGENKSETQNRETTHSNPTYCRKLAPMIDGSSSARLLIISW